jgi:hypothetical protein
MFLARERDNGYGGNMDVDHAKKQEKNWHGRQTLHFWMRQHKKMDVINWFGKWMGWNLEMIVEIELIKW